MSTIKETYNVLTNENYTFLIEKAGVDRNGNMTWKVVVISGNVHLGSWKCQAYTPIEAMDKVLEEIEGE